MDYFKKLDQNPYTDLYWNLPETKQGSVNVVGGNLQNFQTVVHTAEFLDQNYPVSQVQAVLPDVLQKKLPPLPNFTFLPSTDTGSFRGEELDSTLSSVDFNLFVGDFSKNSITVKAIAKSLQLAEKPTLITRDTIDLVSGSQPDPVLANPKVTIFASAPQLQKLLRAIYYPKILLLSQPITQVAETLHKFTLSYAAGLILLYNGQILVAKNGEVQAVSLENSGFSPLSLWNGQLASKIVALNFYNPNNFIPATIAAIFHKKNGSTEP